jgi:hypothetical protein
MVSGDSRDHSEQKSSRSSGRTGRVATWMSMTPPGFVERTLLLQDEFVK